jgi:hypothetical protein
MGRRRAGAAVILYQFVHTLGIVLATLTAIAIAMIVLPMPRGLLVLAFASAIGLVVLAGLVFEASRRGVLARTFDFLARLPVLGRLTVRLARFRPALEAIDQQVSTFTLERGGAFASAVLLEYVGRCLLLCEVYVILWTVGAPLSLVAAFGVDGFSSLIGNAIFFVPLRAGHEGRCPLPAHAHRRGRPQARGLRLARDSRTRYDLDRGRAAPDLGRRPPAATSALVRRSHA